MKSKIVGVTSSAPFIKEKLKKTDSVRLDLIENNLRWLLAVGCIGFSLCVWGYNDLKTDIKDVRSEIQYLRTEMNNKFDKQSALLLEILKKRRFYEIKNSWGNKFCSIH